MTVFEVGDPVRYTGRHPETNTPFWIGRKGRILLVTGPRAATVLFDDGEEVTGVLLGNLELWSPSVKTDKELADEYRALRKQVYDISMELLSRGWDLEIGENGNWEEAVVNPYEFRFTKLEKTIL